MQTRRVAGARRERLPLGALASGIRHRLPKADFGSNLLLQQTHDQDVDILPVSELPVPDTALIFESQFLVQANCSKIRRQDSEMYAVEVQLFETIIHDQSCDLDP